jgi:uncharacterized protein with NRDE domain
VCLLTVLSRTHPDFPLVVGANRDELLDRPAVPMAVLRDGGPRILGGRDQLAGGTWLAVNDAGVVAGLTNRPTPGGRDLTKRSRGELPLFLATHTSAAEAAEAARREWHSTDYNPAWLLVGDRDALFAVDLTGEGAPVVTALPPGIHVLENRAISDPTQKTAHVQELLAGIADVPGEALVSRLRAVLSNHQVPAGCEEPIVAEDGTEIPPQVRAPCVHTEKFGTRWSGLVTVPRDRHAPPTVRFADGSPCTVDYTDATELWRASSVT